MFMGAIVQEVAKFKHGFTSCFIGYKSIPIGCTMCNYRLWLLNCYYVLLCIKHLLFKVDFLYCILLGNERTVLCEMF